jgi:hypothetical protein
MGSLGVVKMFGKDKDKIKRQELMRLAIEAKTPEEKERIRAERMAHSKQTSESIDLEYVAASLKAAGSALTPLGAITGWGQGDLKRLNAEKRQKEQMDALLADRAVQPSAFDELAKLAALRDRGVVTEEEFQEQKKKLLGT